MDNTEWVALAIVIAAIIYIQQYFSRKKNKKSCCGKSCPTAREPSKEGARLPGNHEE